MFDCARGDVENDRPCSGDNAHQGGQSQHADPARNRSRLKANASGNQLQKWRKDAIQARHRFMVFSFAPPP